LGKQVDDMEEENNGNQQDGTTMEAEYRIAVDEIEEPNANQEPQPSVDLENELKFALVLFTASGGGIIAAVVAGFKGKMIGVTNSVAFPAFVSLNLAALITDSIAILLCLKRPPKVSHLAKIVEFALYVSSGSLIFADVWAVCLLLTGNTNTK
ncbi:hypothetical protein MKX03_029798, partial [Papaver bracteatum]